MTPRTPGRPGQRGAATLVIVMMLFLIMALLAAYANRGLLFEQRISNSYYRASIAQEMAEAGAEWTLAMLNGTATDAACQPAATGGQRFADRYVKTVADDGVHMQKVELAGLGIAADCVRTSDGWSCQCADLGSRTPPAPATGAELNPSFGVRFAPKGGQAGTLQLTTTGCSTSVIDDCEVAAINTERYQGRSRQHVLLAHVAAVRTPPSSPLVVQGNVTSNGTGLGLHNTAPGTAGLLVVAGGSIAGLVETRQESTPGTPAALAQIANDEHLATPGVDAFRMFLGATATRYRTHPALRRVTCNGDCGPALEAAYDAGVRIAWVDGAMEIASNRIIGSAEDPMLIVADGPVTIDGPLQLTGMLVSRGDMQWSNTGGVPSLVSGMVLVEGHLTTTGAMDINYLPAVANQLRNRIGGFVRVPGGWIDTFE